MSRVQLRRTITPAAYITLPVRYDAWGDPYVKITIFDELFRGGFSFMGTTALLENGKTTGYHVDWKLVSGAPVRFPKNHNSRGWKP